MLSGLKEEEFIPTLQERFPVGMERIEVEKIIASDLRLSESGCYTPSVDVICLTIYARHWTCDYYYIDIGFSFENNRLSDLNITRVRKCM